MRITARHTSEESVDISKSNGKPYSECPESASDQSADKLTGTSTAIVTTYLEGGAGIAAKRLIC